MDAMPVVNRERLVTQGEVIYQQRLKGRLEPGYHGQIAAIEVESGDYFIGQSVPQAAKKARAKYPHKLFYFVKIGFPVVHVRR